MKILCKKLVPEATLPTKAYEDPAGFDLYAAEEKIIRMHKVVMVGTGLSMAIPAGYFGLICERGSTPSLGVHVQAGVIDSDYRGEVKVVLTSNFTRTAVDPVIKTGDKVAQMVILKKYDFEFAEADKLPDSKRGRKGFGSSG